MIRSDVNASWAHVLWQRHGLRMEDFYNMDSRLQHLYIASELVWIEEKKKAEEKSSAWLLW